MELGGLYGKRSPCHGDSVLEGDDYDIEWVDINWYDWADFPEEALDYADL